MDEVIGTVVHNLPEKDNPCDTVSDTPLDAVSVPSETPLLTVPRDTSAAVSLSEACSSWVSECLSPIQEAVRSLAEKLRIFTDHLEQTLAPVRNALQRMAEAAQALSQKVFLSFGNLGHLALRLLYSMWKRKPSRLEVPLHPSIRWSAFRTDSGLSKPKRVREFVARIRHVLLHKFQRKGDDSKGLEDGVSSIYVMV